MKSKKFIEKFYGGHVRDFIGDSLHPGGLNLTKRLIEVAGLRDGYKVLDIACGSGASVNFIAENFGCEVLGIDISPKLIAIGKSMLTEKTFERAEFIIGDAEFLPCINSYFDVAICESALSLFLDKKRVLNEIYRTLKSGGKFIASSIVLRKKMSAELKNITLFALCISGAETLKKICKLLEETGFANIYVEDHSEKLISLGLELLLSESFDKFSNLKFEDIKSLKNFEEDIIGYVLIAADKPRLNYEI